MNIIIFSASTGGGHNTAAKAVKKYILAQDSNNNVRIIDTFKYINKYLDKTVSKGYVYLATKTPKLYGSLYILTDRNGRYSKAVKISNKVFASKLVPLIKEFESDLIITVHPFSTEMISVLKKEQIINIPLICIMTDYATHSTWLNEEVDGYIVSNEDMKKEMVQRGVTADKVFSFGIPIDEKFYIEKEKSILKHELGLNADMPTILMMAGSFGVPKINEVYREITEIDLEFQLIIITGKNQKLYDVLKQETSEDKRFIELIYFTDEVEKYMKAADLIITKPGGLTVTEALACNVPLITFCAIPGQEEENAEFLYKHHMAVSIDKNKKAADIIVDLLKHREKLAEMKEACIHFDKSKCCENIYSLINKMMNLDNYEL